METQKIRLIRKCLHCGESIDHKRADAKFCGGSCKDSYGHAQRQQEKQQQQEVEIRRVVYLKTKQEIEDRDHAIVEAILAVPINAINSELGKIKSERQVLTDKLEAMYPADVRLSLGSELNGKRSSLLLEMSLLEREVASLKMWSAESDERVYNFHVNPRKQILSKILQPENHPSYVRFTFGQLAVPKNKPVRIQVGNARQRIKQRYADAILKLDKQKQEIELVDEQIFMWKAERAFIEMRLEGIDAQRETLQKSIVALIDADTLKAYVEEVKQKNPVEIQPKPLPKTTLPKVSRQEMSAKDILNLKSETFMMQGELGEFFGQLERQSCAIALTGDSGAGKSYFSYDIAELFDQNGLSVYYFSLEEGLGELTKKKLRDKSFSDKMVLSANGKLSEVRKAAKSFDVIIIDSFGKIEAKTEDYDKLRMDFPRTIFICIFQKTTSGSVRGGASIVFDSSAIIDVQKRDDERIAVMKKSRYGTADWEYSNTDKQIIKR